MGWIGVLFSRQILNGSQDFFFLFNILIFICLFKYETIETHARTFLGCVFLSLGLCPCCYKAQKQKHATLQSYFVQNEIEPPGSIYYSC